jgi:hypothetical protein
LDKLTTTVFIFGLDLVDKTPLRLYNTNIDNNLELPTMRPILIIAVLLISGCANTEWLGKTTRSGYMDYDPCFKCGEKWEQIPPQRFDAQIRYARGERW